MNILIAGDGKVGAMLTRQLSAEGRKQAQCRQVDVISAIALVLCAIYIVL